MKCPKCGVALADQENAQWYVCVVCGWEGHPSEALAAADPLVDDGDELEEGQDA